MSDSVLEALIKGGATAEVIEQYVLTKRQGLSAPPTPTSKSEINIPKPPRPKRKCTEKQLAALAAGRAKNPNMIAKQKRLEEAVKAKANSGTCATRCVQEEHHDKEAAQEEKHDEA